MNHTNETDFKTALLRGAGFYTMFKTFSYKIEDRVSSTKCVQNITHK